jgi:hypothetical protein
MTYKVKYLKIEIQDAGSAMAENPGFETAKILHRLAVRCEDAGQWVDGPLFDLNGNLIGLAEIKTRRV